MACRAGDRVRRSGPLSPGTAAQLGPELADLPVELGQRAGVVHDQRGHPQPGGAARLRRYAFERTRSPGVAIGFGALYAAAGVALIAWGLKPKPLP